MAELFQVINERSSIRAYKAQKLSKEEIGLIVDAGLQAPTARNEQEIHISVVNTENPVVMEIQNALNPEAKNTFFYGAPVLFVLSAKDSFKWSRLDAGIAVENMHLAAKAAGLGSVILGCIDGVLLGEKKAYFDGKLQIPEGYSFQIAMAAGYPDTEKVPHTPDAAVSVSYVD